MTAFVEYPALTLWQWWASAVAWGEKQFETRGWSTNYRGLLAIHAAQRKPTSRDISDAAAPYVLDMLEERRTTLAQLPRGAVLCVVELQDVQPVESVMPGILAKEYRFGDYSTGRYAWKLRVVHVFAEPIPRIGHQKIWKCLLPEVNVV